MNTAKVIPFRKPQEKIQEARNMYSDKFVQGYVMSSRLYRKEVWPFLSDAARNVYAELENRINGHNKESDFVSYSQLQGSDLPGARQLSRRTVSTGLKELVKLGVITVLADGKQGMKSYRLNDVSIKDQFTNETSLPSTPVYLGNQSGSPSTPVTSVPSKHTIDNSIEPLEIISNTPPQNFEPQNRGMLQFVQYHTENSKHYELKELAQEYPVAVDFMQQAKLSFPDLTENLIQEQLSNLAQWSLGQEGGKRSAQKWMTTWLNWLKNMKANKPQVQKPKAPKAEKPKPHRFGQGAIKP